MVEPILSPAQVADILGRAFTETLMSVSERDLPNCKVIGAALLAEMRARGLNVVAIGAPVRLHLVAAL